MSERIFEEKSDGKLINQLRQLHAGLRTGAARLSAHMLHSSEPFPQRERSHSRRPVLSPALRRAGMKRCADGERVRLSCWRREREGRGDGEQFARQLMKKEQKRNARKINKQKQSSLFISVLCASSWGLLSPVPAGERAARGWGISLCASWAEMWEMGCA